MKRIELDGGQMRTREEAHAYMARELGFADYYGGNLDALWDELSTISEPCLITIRHADSVREQLGAYGDRLLDTFVEAAEDNEHCKVELIE